MAKNTTCDVCRNNVDEAVFEIEVQGWRIFIEEVERATVKVNGVPTYNPQDVCVSCLAGILSKWVQAQTNAAS